MAINDTLQMLKRNIIGVYSILEENGAIIPGDKNLENIGISVMSLNMDTSETTHYTQQDVDESGGNLIPIGKTDPLFVIASLTNDGSICIVTRNGDNSDGIIKDYNDTDDLSPFYLNESVSSIYFKKGIFSIGDRLLWKAKGLTHIEFPNTLYSIGTYAVAQTYVSDFIIDEIYIPKSVRLLKPNAFIGVKVKKIILEDQSTIAECYDSSLLPNPDNYEGIIYYPDAVQGSIHIMSYKKATGLYLGKGITVIQGGSAGNFGMNGTGTGELIIPEGVEQIAQQEYYTNGQAFNHARNFTNTVLRLPSTIKKLGYDHLFYDFATSTLKSVEIPESNQYYTSVDGVLYTKDMTRIVFYPPKKSDEFYKLPNTVTKSNDLCFSTNKLLKSMEISDNYVIYAVSGSLPHDRNVDTNFGNALYNKLTSLTSVTASQNNQHYISKQMEDLSGNKIENTFCLFSKDEKKFVYAGPGVKEIYVPEGTTEISVGAIGAISSGSVYWSSNKIIKLYIPKTVTQIAWEYTDSVRYIDIVKAIDVYVDEENTRWTTEEVSGTLYNGNPYTYHRLKRK